MVISRKIAQRLENSSWIRRLFEEGQQMAADGKGPVYDFSIGNPDLEPPKKFKELLIQYAQNNTPGLHKYMANTGYADTRRAVAQSLVTDYDLPFTENNVIMTVGAGGAVNVALKALLDPGDEVIVIPPYFVEYGFYIDNHNGVMVKAPSASDFNLDIDSIAGKITDKTRVVMITNPNNPTGVLYPQETLDALGNLLRERSKGRERPIVLMDDAPYRKLVYDVDHCTSAFAAYEHTLMGTSHSKDLGIPGERIGFLAISPRLQDAETMAQAATFANRTLGFVNAPAMMQRVVAGLQDVTIDLDWYRRKRDRFYKELTRMGYEIPYPAGAFYMFPKAPGGDDIAFINKLKELRVLTVPGSGFDAPGYFRISYCVNDEVIEGALPAFEKAIK